MSIISDPSGDPSSGRVMKLLSFIVAVLLAGYSVYSGNPAIEYVLAFLSVAMGAELVQKVTGK
jgi:hypothetical protein